MSYPYDESDLRVTPNTFRALEQVAAERRRQESKWGEQNHAPPVYLTILGEEFGEACQAALNITSPGEKGMDTAALAEAALRKELVQIAAVAVAAIECLDRGAWKK